LNDGSAAVVEGDAMGGVALDGVAIEEGRAVGDVDAAARAGTVLDGAVPDCRRCVVYVDGSATIALGLVNDNAGEDAVAAAGEVEAAPGGAASSKGGAIGIKSSIVHQFLARGEFQRDTMEIPGKSRENSYIFGC